MSVRIHAVPDPAVESDPKRKAQLLELILTRFHMQKFDASRYENLGILSGDIDQDVLEEMRNLPELSSVSVDEAVYIS
jgi:hypothetical protein